MDLPAVLKRLPFFSDLTDEHLQRLVSITESRSLPSETTVFREGDPPDGMYVVLQGRVRVYMTAEGQDADLATLSAGDFFGEMALLDGQPRSASVQCVDDCSLLLLERSDFLELLKSSPTLLEDVLADLSQRMRGTQEKFYYEMLHRQQTESRMELERQRALSQMVAGVAHEINTPLGIVNSGASLIEELAADESLSVGLDDDGRLLLDDLREAARLMQSNIARASKLIQRFKTLSFHHAAEVRETVSLIEYVEETVELFAIEARKNSVTIDLTHELSGDAAWDGFPGYLSQILLNLLTNAIRHAWPDGQGGKLEVHISDDDADTAKSRVFRIVVRDFGQGIPEENLSKIFDPFFTTGREQGGTGLGLAIVYNLARDSLGGSIEVKSEPGQTEFTLTIPAVVPETSAVGK
jgi:signal transduction histidine kinase